MVFFYYLKIFLTQTSRFQDQIFALLIFQTNQSNKYPLIPPESDETSSVKPVIFQKFEYHYFAIISFVNYVSFILLLIHRGSLSSQMNFSRGIKFAIMFLTVVLQTDTISLISRLRKALFQLNLFIALLIRLRSPF